LKESGANEIGRLEDQLASKTTALQQLVMSAKSIFP